MTNLVNFLLESGISLALLSLIYLLFLRKETFFKINRLFLLGSVLFSVVLPVLKLRIFSPKPMMLNEITVTPYGNLLEAITVYSQGFSGAVEQAVLSTTVLIYIYLAGVFLFFARFMFRILQLTLIIRKGKIQTENGFKLVIIEKETSPFSFLNYVFVSELLMQTKGYDKMVKHELEHVKQGHSLDVIILELLTVFQWFNPFMWMLNRAIRENHEFLADQAVLSDGVSRGEYKSLLLNQFIGGQLVIANNFNYSIIKNRIKMMSKIKSSKIAITKIAFGILVAAALIVAFACEQKESVVSEKNQTERVVKVTLSGELLKFDGDSADVEKLITIISKSGHSGVWTDSAGNKVLAKKIIPQPSSKFDNDEEIFFVVEEMPEFPGGEAALRQFIAGSVKYPDDAVKEGIHGKVYVTFVVSKDGSVANAKIARGVNPSLDAEAIRVVNSLPNWKPGKQRGQFVNVSYTVPINFVLK
jgi:TonB family protein